MQSLQSGAQRSVFGSLTRSWGKWWDRNSGTLPPPMPMHTARPAVPVESRARVQWCRPAAPTTDATADATHCFVRGCAAPGCAE